MPRVAGGRGLTELASPRRALALLALAAALVACAELAGPQPPPPDPRMLRSTIGPGVERLAYELERDRAVLDAFAANGQPDYVWAPVPSELVLLFLAADRGVHLRGAVGARRAAEVRAPIPDEWLEMISPDDRDEVRARRIAGAGRPRAERSGWCADPAEPPPPEVCLRDPEAATRWSALRRRVLEAWRPPPIEHGGERVIVRFRVDPAGALAERCVLGATSPSAARTALAALDTAFPVPAFAGGATCLAGKPFAVRFEIATN